MFFDKIFPMQWTDFPGKTNCTAVHLYFMNLSLSFDFANEFQRFLMTFVTLLVPIGRRVLFYGYTKCMRSISM